MSDIFIKCIVFRKLLKHNTSSGKFALFIDQNESHSFKIGIKKIWNKKGESKIKADLREHLTNARKYKNSNSNKLFFS